MSSMERSLLFLKKNLRRNVSDPAPLPWVLQNYEPDMKGLVPPRINWTQINFLTNTNINFPRANPRMTICKLNVKGFELEDLVARIENGFIVIIGRHHEKRDKYGYISRMFSRRVAIPRDFTKDDIKIHLFPKGILLITGKKRSEILKIPVQQISLPAMKKKINPATFRQQLYRRTPTMFNPGYLKFLKMIWKSLLSRKHKTAMNKLSTQHRNKIILSKNYKKNYSKN